MNLKKFFAAIIFSLVAAMNSFSFAAEPTVLADSAILIEASTGRILWEKNSDERREPASMTKMLTGVLALEKLDPLSTVNLDQEAVWTEATSLGWSTTDSLAVRDMVNAVMIVSENGGAVALAHAVAGTTEKFADMMNDKAKSLGCKDTHFANPNGLPDANHYSTAADMARIAMYCMKNPAFRDVVDKQHATVHWLNPKDKAMELANTNELLYGFNGANGIKTGWTGAAGGCLAASAKRGEIELIAIVMHSPDHESRFTDAANLLNYGFERVRMISGINKDRSEKTVLVRGGKRATLRVAVEKSFDFPLMTGEDAKLFKVTYDIPKIVDAGNGIEKGKILGEAVLNYDGKPVARLPLVARENVDEGFSFGSLIVEIVSSLFVK